MPNVIIRVGACIWKRFEWYGRIWDKWCKFCSSPVPSLSCVFIEHFNAQGNHLLGQTSSATQSSWPSLLGEVSWCGSASQVLRHPYTLTLFEESVYWTDRATHKVLRANKWHGGNQSVVMYNIFQPLGIVAVHPVKQPYCKWQHRNFLSGSSVETASSGNAYCRRLPCLGDSSSFSFHAFPSPYVALTFVYPRQLEPWQEQGHIWIVSFSSATGYCLCGLFLRLSVLIGQLQTETRQYLSPLIPNTQCFKRAYCEGLLFWPHCLWDALLWLPQATLKHVVMVDGWFQHLALAGFFLEGRGNKSIFP